MRTLALLCLAACTTEHGVAPPDAFEFPRPPATPVRLSWTLQTADGIPQVCPGDSVVDVLFFCGRLGGGIGETVPCSVGSVMTGVAPQPRDSCGVGLRIRDGSGALFAQTDPTFVPATGVLTNVNHTVITDRGRLHTHWKITKGGLAANCMVVAVDKVSVTVTTPSGMGTSFTVDCLSMSGPTNALPTGPAHVMISAGTVSASRDVEVPTGMLMADLPPVTLAFP